MNPQSAGPCSSKRPLHSSGSSPGSGLPVWSPGFNDRTCGCERQWSWLKEGQTCHLECRIKPLSPTALAYLAVSVSSTSSPDMCRPCCDGQCVIISCLRGALLARKRCAYCLKALPVAASVHSALTSSIINQQCASLELTLRTCCIMLLGSPRLWTGPCRPSHETLASL